MSNTLSSADYTRSLPLPLKSDVSMHAFCRALADELKFIAAETYKNIIYARIRELPEKLIDILAYDLHVDWYDSRLPLDVKRSMVENSVKVHKYLGTPYAVKKVLSEVFEMVEITEWFEKNPLGQPFTFSLSLDASNDDLMRELQQEILKRLLFYKNLRSHLEGVSFQIEERGHLYFGAYSEMHCDLAIYPKMEAEGKLFWGGYSSIDMEMDVRPQEG